ncbi:MAG: metallophosphoesterase [Gemmataceae bacterium]
MALVRELFGGPLDVVGDVHGEIEALRALLGRLGYDPAGRHPDGRRLVFVGDLADRGPDSPGVVRLVRRLADDGRAQVVMGNHEFNALKAAHDGKPKPDLSWLFPAARPFRHRGQTVPQTAAGPHAAEVLAFFASLPVALERGGPDPARVVHACWDDDAVELVRDAADVIAVYDRHRQRIERSLDAVRGEDERELRHQNDNPVKLLTSGRETLSPNAIVINEKPRYRHRDPWWGRAGSVPLTVVGHYWRVGLPGEEHEAHLFGPGPRHALLGSVMCVDFSVGRRFRERIDGPVSGPYLTSLGALRLPERVLYFDNAEPVRLLEG